MHFPDRIYFSAGATSWPEQLLGRSNFLAGATSRPEQLLGWSISRPGQLLGWSTSRPGRFSACTVGRPKDHTFASQSDTGHCCGLRRISDTAASAAASLNPAVRSGANGHDPHKGTKGGERTLTFRIGSGGLHGRLLPVPPPKAVCPDGFGFSVVSKSIFEGAF